MTKKRGIIYKAHEWGKDRYFLTWDKDKNGNPIGGHEIGSVSDPKEKLLNNLLEICELD